MWKDCRVNTQNHRKKKIFKCRKWWYLRTGCQYQQDKGGPTDGNLREKSLLRNREKWVLEIRLQRQHPKPQEKENALNTENGGT